MNSEILLASCRIPPDEAKAALLKGRRDANSLCSSGKSLGLCPLLPSEPGHEHKAAHGLGREGWWCFGDTTGAVLLITNPLVSAEATPPSKGRALEEPGPPCGLQGTSESWHALEMQNLSPSEPLSGWSQGSAECPGPAQAQRIWCHLLATGTGLGHTHPCPRHCGTAKQELSNGAKQGMQAV